MGVTEHMEGDECKFAIWTGRTPMSENKTVLKAATLEVKQAWVKRLREMIQETYFNTALPNITVPAMPPASSAAATANSSSKAGAKGRSGGGKDRLSR